MPFGPIESLEKYTVGSGPANTAAEENMCGTAALSRPAPKHTHTSMHATMHIQTFTGPQTHVHTYKHTNRYC
jgi:hypothetical protein